MSEQHGSLNSGMCNDFIGADLRENMDNYLGSLKEGKLRAPNGPPPNSRTTGPDGPTDQ